MPVLTFPNLLIGRPAVRVFVGPPPEWNELRVAQELPPVYPVEATALIDTGAVRTLIGASLAKRLGLPPLGDSPVLDIIGVSGPPVPAARLVVSLTFVDGPPVPAATMLQVCAVPDDALARFGLQMLLGRDFLATMLMVVYNGPEDRLTLAF
jgi:hypothetical protein